MAATDGVALVALAPGDAPRALALSAEAGWNQIEADWRFMLGAGAGVGAVDAGGALIGSALVLPLGPRLRWISMVIVAAARRDEGIGSRLMRRCLGRIGDERAVAGLDATELGHPVYLKLGFRDVWSFARWRAERLPAVVAPAGVRLRAAIAADLPRLAALDAAASGFARAAMLAHLLDRAPGAAWLAERDDGAAIGFALGRVGRLAAQIGPVVAPDAAVARALLARAAADLPSPLFLDLPDAQGPCGRFLADAGGAVSRRFTRMLLGDAGALGDPSRLVALAGPELG